MRAAIQEAQGEVILLGDFNCHHPRWGGMQAATETQAEHLLHATTGLNLTLTTPVGDPTWKRGKRESVIDLTFVSPYIERKLIQCGTQPDWAITADHIPILIRIDTTTQPPAESKRFNLKKLNEPAFREAIKKSHWETQDDPLTALQGAITSALN